MVDVYLIRHAQSIANAGHVTAEPGLITLSDLGREQAADLALTFEVEPVLIVMSPYIRTQETAEPTIARFPHVPQEIWPIHEFTYLALDKCRNTTTEQRHGIANEYWQRMDPAHIDGHGAESFSQMITRIRDMVLRLEQKTEGPIFIFTHGQFIQALRQILNDPASTDLARMQGFKALEATDPVKNASVLHLKVSDGKLGYPPQPPAALEKTARKSSPPGL